MKRIYLALALLSLAGCSEDNRVTSHAKSAVLLSGYTNVTLHPPYFDCVATGDPAIRKPGLTPTRSGMFFQAKRGGVPVYGSVCVGRGGSGESNVKLLSTLPSSGD
ncbi:hypothetical protein KIKIMORA_02070 [Brevundimonas phage vB_BpoS-Kikimora]|uniref:Lipoprotein n=1 Tax=Brevundimonas phage vB_BpoS-Kikimora TaxID=2948601 RepID=A0A9E7SKB6_9CAUD|nr:hypothetical protein KIKIMORA_02070 [Brevundimonas phage vB_BpoS-Kikimora]